jgi:hypothetical protein
VTWTNGDPNAVIKRVLDDPSYRDARATTAEKPHESLLGVIWDWIAEHLRPLFHPIAKALGATQGASTLIGYVLIGLALVALVFAVFRLVLAFARPPIRPGGRQAESLALDADRTSPEWRALARVAAARGDYAGAIAALFGAALAELDARALVAFDAARTPGEYRRLVRRARAQASAPFDDLAERFVRALYAPERPQPSDYEAAERALAAFEPALAS